MLLGVSVLTFVLFFLLPGDPASASVPRQATPEVVEQVRERMGLHQPAWKQYLDFLHGPDRIGVGRPSGILNWPPNLGYSFKTEEPVLEIIADRLPVTLSLAFGSVVLWLLIGIPVGMQAALSPRSIRDRVTTFFVLLGASAPVFLVGMTLLYVFSFKLDIFPAPGYTPLTENPIAWAQGLFLAWLTVATGLSALYARLTRTGMLEVQHEDYIRTARAKGLHERRVVTRHIMRPTLTPIVTLLGLDLGALVGGAVVAEVLFGLPGTRAGYRPGAPGPGPATDRRDCAYQCLLRGDVQPRRGHPLCGIGSSCHPPLTPTRVGGRYGHHRPTSTMAWTVSPTTLEPPSLTMTGSRLRRSTRRSRRRRAARTGSASLHTLHAASARQAARGMANAASTIARSSSSEMAHAALNASGRRDSGIPGASAVRARASQRSSRIVRAISRAETSMGPWRRGASAVSAWTRQRSSANAPAASSAWPRSGTGKYAGQRVEGVRAPALLLDRQRSGEGLGQEHLGEVGRQGGHRFGPPAPSPTAPAMRSAAPGVVQEAQVSASRAPEPAALRF